MRHADDDLAGLAGGVVLDSRYRLEQVRDDSTGPEGRRVVLWRALDLALDRHVAVLFASGRNRAVRKEVVDAATRAGRVGDARCVRVLDVGELDADARFTWIVTEWVDAPTLAAVVRRTPLPVSDAIGIVRHCAQALATAAREGCRHGHLQPDRVFLPVTGVPRLTGLELAAALADGDPGVDDVRGLGGLLVAALTGTWPLPGWTGLPATPPGARVRQLRREVSRPLDEVAARALAGSFRDAAAVAAALDELPESTPAETSPAGPSRRLLTTRRWAWRVVPPVVVTLLGVTGWLVGSELGRVPLAARTHRATLPTAGATAPGSEGLHLVWSGSPRISSFDPEGDGEETPNAVGLAVDADPSTSWTTATYRGSARFGGLKPGVGLLIDLRRRTVVRAAALALTAPGATVELRAGDQSPRVETDLPVVASRVKASQQLRWDLPRPVTARYWLVWFTQLPPVEGGYRIGVTEVALLG